MSNRYEDLRALDGGNDGLEVIKIVLHHANQTLRPGRTLLLEVKHLQWFKVILIISLLKKTFQYVPRRNGIHEL